jgi:hypothetical protein
MQINNNESNWKGKKKKKNLLNANKQKKCELVKKI